MLKNWKRMFLTSSLKRNKTHLLNLELFANIILAKRDKSPSHPDYVLNQPAYLSTLFSPLKFIGNDKPSSVQKGALGKNYAHADHISSQTATHLNQVFLEQGKNIFMQINFKIWFLILFGISHRKTNLQKNLWLNVLSTCLGKTGWFQKLTHLLIFFPEFWITESS